jgi:ribosomal protein S18 acetylase RimI-like enzyme
VKESEVENNEFIQDHERPEFFTRTLKSEDVEAVFELLRTIASKQNAFVRLEEEISHTFIDKTLKRAENGGLAFGAFERGSGQLLGLITSRKLALKAFEHILSSVTIGVHPDFQKKGVGRRLFVDFLEHVQLQRDDITRVELVARDSNEKMIQFYESMGFRREGRFEKRVRNSDGTFEADIPMGWLKHD